MGQTNVNLPRDDSSGMGAGMIIGLLLAVLIIGFLIWWFLLNDGNGGGTPVDGSTAPLESLVESLLPGESLAPSELPSVSPSTSPSA